MFARLVIAPRLNVAFKSRSTRALLLAVVAFAGLPPRANAQAVPVDLGAAASFAVLGGSTVTNTGATIVNGDFGLSPGTAFTGFPPGIVVNGTVHATDSAAAQAQTAALAAYNILAGETSTHDLSGQNLGSRTLTPGVYFFSAAAQLTGTLTLDAGNDPNARFDFRIGTTLDTDAGSLVSLINGAQAADIFWQVGTSATFVTSTSFVGTVLASTSITAGTGTTVDGRLLALTAAVTLDDNIITVPTAIPEPATTALTAAVSALGLAFWRRRRAAS